jgi:thiol-disulfide isomerase/thioredoxin
MNKIFKDIIYFVIFHLLALSIKSQSIKIGDRLPELELSDVINWSTTTLKTSQLKGKVIIFDFWNHNCKACIRDFSKLDSLQKSFSEKIQIVLVNRESKDSTIHFFSKLKNIKLPSLPMIMGDRLLSNLFPSSTFPYSIWVDSQGVINFFTNNYNTTTEHVKQILGESEASMKNRTYTKKKYGSLFGLEDRKWESQLLYYSYISKCNDSISVSHFNGISIDGGEKVRLSDDCQSIAQLYKRAFSEGNKYDFDVIGCYIFQTKDSFKYFFPVDKNKIDFWRENYAYSYDLIIPFNQKRSMYKIMQQDLKRSFGLNARIEVRQLKSYALVKSNSSDKLKTKGGKSVNNLWPNPDEFSSGDSVLLLQNLPWNFFVERLKIWCQYNLGPFYDETNYFGNVDVSIRSNSLKLVMIKNLRQDLKKYGLDFIEKSRKVTVLVISDK